MKYLPSRPIEEQDRGEGMIFLFIPGGDRTDKGSPDMPSPGPGNSGKAGFRSAKCL